jgi:hypothetical protein
LELIGLIVGIVQFGVAFIGFLGALRMAKFVLAVVRSKWRRKKKNKKKKNERHTLIQISFSISFFHSS